MKLFGSKLLMRISVIKGKEMTVGTGTTNFIIYVLETG
jgi:hypothetical protein